MRPATLVVLSFAVLIPSFARLEVSLCGTHRDSAREEVHLHRHMTAKRRTLALAASPADASRDVGDIALIEDTDGVVARRNDFNLDRRTIQFSPAGAGAARYRFKTGDASYDTAAASSGVPISTLGDDDTFRLALPFTFPFFGKTYQEVFVNSDGNLTFGGGDAAITSRSLGRLTAGLPRIGGLFMDLDPTRRPNSVLTLSEDGRVVVSWAGAPEYQTGIAQTFQIRLYPDGRIEFAYNGVFTSGTDGAVVGISPGGLLGTASIVSFATGTSEEYASTVAERFGGSEEVDIVTAAQKFYQTHDDSYDYLVIYNTLGIGPCAGSVACETTVRNGRSGYGDVQVEVGQEFGSASRLQAVLNMGPLSQYPVDPAAIVPGRATIRDTPITVIAHETGHLFLAYASVRDPNDPAARPMLGFQSAHWAFTFNSEASLLEGNRIRDNGAAVSPRFTTIGTVEGYSPLDQYLMGFRAPEEVPPMFLVTGSSRNFNGNPGQTGVSFDGQRRDVAIPEIISAQGRRTPDSTVSQRRFRFAFLLIVAQGSTPSQANLDQLDTYRRQFETFYVHAASDRASADTALRSSLRLSTFPAAGVLAGRSLTASISIQKPAPVPLTIALKTQTGASGADPSVTIPAGATTANFKITGIRAGVDEISAQPADSHYDSAVSRIQVLAGPDAAQLTLLSGDSQPVTMRVSDANDLPYPGVPVQVSVTGGSVTPNVALSDSNGRVSFVWNPAAGSNQVLTARVEGSTGAPVFVAAPSAGNRLSFTAPVNAASGTPGLAPGGIATILGTNLSKSPQTSAPFPWPDKLAGVQVLLDGKAAPVLYVSSNQINFLVPLDQSVGSARITVVSGEAVVDLPILAPVTLVSPGIFINPATGYGRILIPGTTHSTEEQPVARGAYVEIYATGLGPVGDAALVPQVTIHGAEAKVTYSGLAPGYLGVYQVNVQVPEGASSGEQLLALTVNGVTSNTVKIGIQ